ncbi:MAG: hypothetical protein IKG46_07855 [Solobacterium sp.]|nr:hypothetical protein [Solobacterium sp.]
MRRNTLFILPGMFTLLGICLLCSGLTLLPYILAAGWIISGMRQIAWDEEGMGRGLLKIVFGLLLLASPFVRMSLGITAAVFAAWFLPVIVIAGVFLPFLLLL